MNKLKTNYKHIFLSLTLAFFASCNQPSFINLTSKNISQNPSGIYTLQTELDIQDRKINPETSKYIEQRGSEMDHPALCALWGNKMRILFYFLIFSTKTHS